MAILLLLYLFGGAAEAQFSGPTLGASTAVNRPVTPTTDPAILYPAARDIHIGQGDTLAVRIYGATDFAPPVRVSLDGTIQLPLIGSVAIEGLTVHQTENLIAKRLLNAGMYRDPQVTVQITESPNNTITVSGEVHAVFPATGEKRLFDILSAAGGLPPTASHMITINRPGVAEPIVVDLGTDPAKSDKADLPIFARDTVIVSRVGVVYVLGAFKTQGAFPLQQNSPLTLMQVAALGGGPGFEGRLGDLRLIRTIGTERKVVHVDIDRVFNGKDPDPVLQTDDIVFLPSSRMKAAIKSGGLSTLLGIASILLIAVQQ